VAGVQLQCARAGLPISLIRPSVGKKVIAMIADQHFATSGRSISNLDPCNLCGCPRSAHGIDWTCPPRPFEGRSSPGRDIAVTVLGGLLALALIIWVTVTSATKTSIGTLAASALLAAAALVVSGAIVGSQRHRGRRG
jgi:hypothetical protein